MSEEWRPVVGWEGLYEVSDKGRVRSLDRVVMQLHPSLLVLRPFRYKGRVLKFRPHQYGYPRVGLYRDGQETDRLVPHLVAEAFIGPRPVGMDVCHNDSVSSNNHRENLRYDTRKGNMADAVRQGRMPRGTDRWNARLTPADIPIIRASTEPTRCLAERYGVCRESIRAVRIRRAWAWVA